MTETRQIVVLAFEGAQLLDIAGPLQMFAGANDALGRPAYAARIAALTPGPIQTSSGVTLAADIGFEALDDAALAGVDTMVVVGGDPGLKPALRQGQITAIIEKASQTAPRIASVCTGAFFLAAAGLLDGRRAATHWDAARQLQRFRPAIDVDPDAIHVQDGKFWTSAGVTAGIDLTLAMIEADHGRAPALAVAQRHVIHRVRPGGQSQFSAALVADSAAGGADGRIGGLAARIIAAPSETWTVDSLAAEANVSPRTLARQFQKRLGAPPAAFVERARIDFARRALVETEAGIEAIAHDAGFGGLRRMDRAFARAIGVTPSDFRARFKSSPPTPTHT